VVSHTANGDTARAALRVLVVDDNRDAADSLAVLVGLWGHDVRPAYDAASALSVAHAHRPHVVLLDLAMPQTDGLQLARQLEQEVGLEDAALVVVTGYADRPHRCQAAAAGLQHYLVKPVDLQELQSLLRGVVSPLAGPSDPA
jgi:CheY-like chemotaxis protein